jgi:hypothetical protein
MMAAKADFTEEEWELLREGPATAGMIVLLASGGGSFRETWALAKTFAEARQQQGASQLLDELLDEKPDVTRFGSAEEAEQQGLNRLGRAVALLEQKATPDDVEGYKRFTLEVADRDAAAHKEEGQALSGGESEAIAKITAALSPGST